MEPAVALIEQELTSDVRLLQVAVEQFVGRERRERVSQVARCGEGCFDSRRRLNSDVGRLSVSYRRGL